MRNPGRNTGLFNCDRFMTSQESEHEPRKEALPIFPPFFKRGGSKRVIIGLREAVLTL